MRDEARRRLDDPNANEYEKIAARAVLRNPEYHEQEQPMKESSNGLFGTIYNQFKGKAQAAIYYLLGKGEGIAKGALHHPQVGDIDLWYGNEDAGLKKIADKHPEVLDDLQGILDGMEVKSSSDNRIILESATHRAVVSRDWFGKKADNWLLTAYEKKDASGGSIDIVPEPERGKQNGTAPLQDNLSEGKVSEKVSDVQENVEKSSVNVDGLSNAKDYNAAERAAPVLAKDREKNQKLMVTVRATRQLRCSAAIHKCQSSPSASVCAITLRVLSRSCARQVLM